MLKLWDKKRLDFSIKMSLVPLICFILMVSACSSGTNTTQSSGKEIPTGGGGPEEIILVNPDPAKITLDAPTDPARLTIHLPGVPVPLPKGLQGYEIWRGPSTGFTISDDGLSATNGAVKIADSTIDESGRSLSDTHYADDGSFFEYENDAWAKKSSTLSDGTSYSYIVRYTYKKADNTAGWSSGVVVSGPTMSFPEAKDLNMFASAQGVSEPFIIVRWTNPDDPQPAPDMTRIYRRTTPFIGDDITGAGIVHEHSYSGNYDRWKDETVTDGENYYYYISYVFSNSDWSNNTHTGAGPCNATAAVPGSAAEGNPFEIDRADITIESANKTSTLTWTNFQLDTFPSEGKVIILKGPGPDPVNIDTPGADTFVIQYWNIKEGPGIIAEDKLCGTNGYAYSFDPDNVSISFTNLPEDEYSYAFYVVDNYGRISQPYQMSHIHCVTVNDHPVSNVTLSRSKRAAPADITVSYTLPQYFDASHDRVEIYYSKISQDSSEKGNFFPKALKGESDNYTGSSAVLSGASDGDYYFTVYAVFDNNNGRKLDAPAANSGKPVTLEVFVPTQKVSITQNGSNDPVIPHTYNFDQTLTMSSSLIGGEIRYTVTSDGSDPAQPAPSSALYDPESKPVLSASGSDAITYRIKAAYFTGEGIDPDSISGISTYAINYGAYNYRFTVEVRDTSGNVTAPDDVDGFKRSASDREVWVKYEPGCGEMFSIYRNPNYSVQKTSDSGLTSITSFVIPAIENRCDAISEGLVSLQTNPQGFKDFDAKGRDFAGGCAYRAAYRLHIEGRAYASDPASGYNADLITNQNIKKPGDIYVVYPKLSMKNLAMFERKAMTPYLWLQQEPVLQADVEQTDFFTGLKTPANSIKAHVYVEYARQKTPYGNAASGTDAPWYKIYNSNGAQWTAAMNRDPQTSDKYALSGSSIDLIKVDPLPQSVDADMPSDWNGKKWRSDGSNYMRTVPALAGRVYYQIPNPYDTNKIGTKAHTDCINTTGELDAQAFRTVLRFRVKAMNTSGYRDTDRSLNSFEANEAAPYDVTTSDNWEGGPASVTGVRRLDVGTAPKTSDFTDGFTSYPIEVCEDYEGWGNKNVLETNWYQKHGVTFMGDGIAGPTARNNNKNERDDSRYKHFDPSKRKILISLHGLEATGYYDFMAYKPIWGTSENQMNPTDRSTWEGLYGTDGEWSAGHWRSRGYNVALIHWHKWNNSSRNNIGINIPGPSNKKIWYPTGSHGMAFFSGAELRQGSYSNVSGAILADCIRSASMGNIVAQEIIDAMPGNYAPAQFTLCGQSLGNNLITNAAYKLFRKTTADPTYSKYVPSRIDLVDPYFPTDTTDDGSAIGGDNDKYLSAITGRAYADVLHYYARIPYQWYKTTAMTQTTIGENDTNSEGIARMNFVKLYFGTCDDGYIKTGTFASRMGPNLHTEANTWYYRSIQRDGTNGYPNDSNGTAISAATSPTALYNRLNAANFRRGPLYSGSAWSFFEMDKGAGNNTIFLNDDAFAKVSTTDYSGSGGGKPNM